MPKTRIPSPARSQGPPLTPRRYTPRGSRSVGSPARSTASGRLSSIVDQFKENNRDSYAPSPLCKTLLSDNTDIEQPRRNSWWKKVDNSRDVMEILDNQMLEERTNVIDALDVEVLSQEREYTVHLSESSGSESISSIVIPQRKLFIQKENKPINQFDELIGPRESVSKHDKTNADHDKTAKVSYKNLFSQRPKRPKPVFPSALLIMSPDKTITNNTRELAAEVKGQPRNLFGKQPGVKRKNMFADFVMSESEDDISEIQPRVFTFHKPEPVPRRSSTMSIATDIEMDDWKLLPSSTMVDHQLDAVTPRKDRLRKLSEMKESDTGSKNITVNKAKQSNKSVVDVSTKKLVKAALSNIAVTDTIQDQQNNEDEDEDFSLTYDDNDPIMDQNNQENVMNNSEHDTQPQEVSDHVNNKGTENMGEEIQEKIHVIIQENVDSVAEIDQKVIEAEEDGDIQENKMDTNEADFQENGKGTNNKEKGQEKALEPDIPENKIGANDVEKETETEKMEVEDQHNIEEGIDNKILVKSAPEIETEQQKYENSHVDVELNEKQNEDVPQNEIGVNGEDKERDREEMEVKDQNKETEVNDNQAAVENDEEVETEQQKYEESQINDELNENEEEEDSDNQAVFERNEEIENNQREYEESQINDELNENEEKEDSDNQAVVESDEEIENNQREYEESQVNDELNDSEEEASDNQAAVESDKEMETEQQEFEERQVDDELNESEEEAGDNQAAVESDKEMETEQQEYEESQVDDEPNEEQNNDEQVHEEEIEKEDEENAEIEQEASDTEANIDGDENRPIVAPHRDSAGINPNVRPSFAPHRGSTGIRPSVAPHRNSTGISDKTKNSSAEGSGWDSHRTTRRTLRQTFGKDFTPRKSLRALVMEKSAKRTAINEANAALRFPKANLTELPQANSTEIPMDNLQSYAMEYEEQAENVEMSKASDHEVTKRMRQTALEEYMQKLKRENIERNRKIEEKVKNMFKPNPGRIDYLNQVPHKPAVRRIAKPVPTVPKKRQKQPLISEELPEDFLEDLKYKPPKRFRPRNASWITNRLYKFIETKLEPKYDYRARVRAENLIETIYNFTQDVRKLRVAPLDSVARLKKEMARLKIVQTHYDFYVFFREYMPLEVKIKVVPDIVNQIPVPRNVFDDIITET